MEAPPRRICILWVYGDSNPAWRLHGATLWASALQSAGEPGLLAFTTLDATDMSTPLPQPAAFPAFVITGSPHGAYEPLPWISRLLAWLRDCAALAAPPRVLGGCFGAQALALALGGAVAPTPPFEVAATLLQLRPEPLAALPWAAPLRARAGAGGGGVRLLESHGDGVTALPPGGEVLASSPRCPNEVFVVRNGAGVAWALGCQAHPEFTVEGELKGIVWPRVVPSRVGAEAAAAAEASYALPRHEAEVLRAARLFLEEGEQNL